MSSHVPEAAGREDRDLVTACLAGDVEAFGGIVDRYQRVLFNVAIRMSGDYEDARDITQAVFVKIYENLASFNPQFKFYSWIYRITINESLNWIKKRRPQEPPDLNLVSKTHRPDQELEEDQTSRIIQAVLLELSPDYRSVVVLRHFHDLSYRDMSSALNVPEKTIKSRLFTARRLLGDLLRERGLVEGRLSGPGGKAGDPGSPRERRLQG